jgi:hypothetical protein
MKKLTTEEFIKRASNIHGTKYGYSLVIYNRAKEPIKIICSEHGIFEQAPSKHLEGRGCWDCGVNKQVTARTKSLDNFIKEANDIHNYIYDYSQVIYKNTNISVIIICKEHGPFSQSPTSHLSGTDCPQCAIEKQTAPRRLSMDNFIERATIIHGNKYDYSIVQWKDSQTEVIIICHTHGNFNQKPVYHLTGRGCYFCGLQQNSISRTKTNDNFIKESNIIHHNKYNYSLTNYIGTDKEVIIICPKHGQFNQLASNHLSGHGCKNCAGKISVVETQWLDILNIPIEYRQQHIRIGSKRFKVDAYDPHTNIVYEFNGDFWHGNPEVYDPEDINYFNKKKFGELYQNTLEKEKHILLAGYNLISIWESDFNNFKKRAA